MGRAHHRHRTRQCELHATLSRPVRDVRVNPPGAGVPLEKRCPGTDIGGVHNTSTDPRPRPPEAPLPSDCCGGGCLVCVLDAYQQEVEHYEARLAAWRLRHPEPADGPAEAGGR